MARKKILNDLKKEMIDDVTAVNTNDLGGKKKGSKRNNKAGNYVNIGKDPISQVLRTNDRAYKFHCAMNQLLLKILDRYEMDKPILMADKLDIIWDKDEKKLE